MGSNESVSEKVIDPTKYSLLCQPHDIFYSIQESVSLSEEREWRIFPQQAVQLRLIGRQLSPSATTFADACSYDAPGSNDSRHVDKILGIL